MYLFLALYIIEFLKFLNFLEKSDLNRSLCVCVCVWQSTDSEEFVLLSRVRNEGAIRDLWVLGSDPSDTAI